MGILKVDQVLEQYFTNGELNITPGELVNLDQFTRQRIDHILDRGIHRRHIVPNPVEVAQAEAAEAARVKEAQYFSKIGAAKLSTMKLIVLLNKLGLKSFRDSGVKSSHIIEFCKRVIK